MKRICIDYKYTTGGGRYSVSDEAAEEIMAAFTRHGGKEFSNDGVVLEVDAVEGKGRFAMAAIAGIRVDEESASSVYQRGSELVRKEVDHAEA